ncbi:MAG: sigma 54-interacting transcriptional regulator [Candidatus Sumerlaeaceae bacterium]|nr:sigma 54-interacting transcriptional regulator [Candidatus Sumerlaeaceae bacterium]
MSSLLVIKGPNLGVRYEIGDRARIGRGEDTDIQVADPNVSRHHAEIVRNRMAYTIIDTGSKNGVQVNGEWTKEKLLLRNDEIQIGNTVFLFNSDLNIRNARFSNNSVYLYPAENATVEIARKQSQLSTLTGPDRQSVDFLLRFSELFAGEPAPLSQTANRLMSQVMELLLADGALLLLRDSISGEMLPIVALPPDVPARINRQLLATVAEDRNALLLSERTPDLATAEPVNMGQPQVSPKQGEPVGTLADETNPAWNETTGSAQPDSPVLDEYVANPAYHSTLCAPLVQDDQTIGIMLVEKKSKDFFSLRDLGLLQAVARMATGTLQAAQVLDRLSGAETATVEEKIIPSRNTRVQEIFVAAARAALGDSPMLILGEGGTGKEVLARHIHESSGRGNGPFITVNCAAVLPALMDIELFGYERGAFSGATKTTLGRIERAEAGTLFLDDISEMEFAVQAKLLRFIQERVFYRVGGLRAINANARIVAASSVDLPAAVAEGKFREDLLARLGAVTFQLPPLRERREDVAALTDAFIQKHSQRMGKKILGANDAAISMLQNADWPGNIRELDNAVERAVLLSRNRILAVSDFSRIEFRGRRQIGDDSKSSTGVRRLEEIERSYIEAALREYNWNQVKAAEALGIHRNTLRNKIAEYGLDSDRER